MDGRVGLHIVQVVTQFCEELKNLYYLTNQAFIITEKEALGRIQSPPVLFTNAQMYHFHLKMFADILKVMNLRNKSPWCNFHSFFVSLRNKYST